MEHCSVEISHADRMQLISSISWGLDKLDKETSINGFETEFGYKIIDKAKLTIMSLKVGDESSSLKMACETLFTVMGYANKYCKAHGFDSDLDRAQHNIALTYLNQYAGFNPDLALMPDNSVVNSEHNRLPAIGSVVYIHLSSLNKWVARQVVAYEVFDSFEDNNAYHRVFIHVKDSKGTTNCRLLKDIRYIDSPDVIQQSL